MKAMLREDQKLVRQHAGRRRSIELMLAALACASTSAHAQTTPAAVPAFSVTMYGLLDVSLAYASNPAGHTLKMDSGHVNGSRLGFRGSEDLGDGLRANFLLESGVTLDTGTLGQNQGAGGKMWGRGAYVGLSGGFGELRLGRTPLTITSEAQAAGDAFGLGGSGNAQGIQPATGRSNNTVWYASPSFGGVAAKLSYSFGEQADTKSGNHASAGLFYSKGPISAAAAFTVLRHPVDQSSVRWVNTGASYDFGIVKLFGTLASFKNPGAALTPAVHAGLDGTVQLAGFPLVGYYSGQDDRSASIGVSVPLGFGSILAQVVKLDDRGPLDRDATQFGVEYIYNLSKRTSLYTGYGRVSNHNGAAYGLTGATTQAALSPAGDSYAYHMGVRHAF